MGALMNTLREAFADQELGELITLADAVTGLLHELNNCLHRVALQASVIQMETTDGIRAGALQVRQDVAQAAVLLRPLAMVRVRQREVHEEVDVNAIVAEVLASQPQLSEQVRFKPGKKLPSLSCHPGALRRLLVYGLRLAVDGLEAGDAISLRSEKRGSQLRLVLEQEGASLAERFNHEPDIASPESLLQRLAFQSMLRLLNGRFESGRSVALTWPVPT